ncbi:hypothetical protein LSH36_27g04034, partial [Paralvinella palmiformis]
MMSVFSENAPKNVKVHYAFRIYDFNGDDMIDEEDLRNVISRLIGTEKQLSEENTQKLIDNTNPVFQIFQEADLDDDKMLSYAEFEHVISKAPDFV